MPRSRTGDVGRGIYGTEQASLAMNSVGVFLTVRDRVIRVRGVRDYMNRLGIG